MLPLLPIWACASELPSSNVAGDFDADQALGAFLGLTPWAWGWLVAFVAIAIAIAIALRPLAKAKVEVDDVDPIQWRQLRPALLLVVGLFYARGLTGNFNLFDDKRFIIWEERVHSLNADTLHWSLLENPGGNNMELMFLSFQLNWWAAGDDYRFWYAANLLLLFLPGLYLVQELAFRLLRHRVAALMVSAIVAFNPLSAELLAWMSGRGHLMGWTLALLSVVAYLRFRDDGRKTHWLALSFLAFALTQVTKPIFVYVPMWLVLLDLLKGRTDLRRAAAEKLIFFALAGLSLARMLSGSSAVGRVKADWWGGSLQMTLAQDLNLLVEYGRSVFFPYFRGALAPHNVATDWLHTSGVPMILPFGFAPLASGVVLLCALVAAAVLFRRGQRLPLVLALAFLASLATVMNIPAHTTPFAYRYTAGPMVLGAIGMVGAVLAVLRAHRAPALRNGAMILAGLWLALGVFHSNRAANAWKSSSRYWTTSAAHYPYDGWSNYFAGKAMQHRGKLDVATDYVQVSLRYLPTNLPAYERLGHLQALQGNCDEALEAYGQFLAAGQELDDVGKTRRDTCVDPFD